MNLGTAYFARKMEKEAMEEYQSAMRIDPEVFEHHGTYGIMLEERTVEEKAKYHYALAKLYATASRQELALQYLRKALEEGFRDRKKLTEDPEFQAMRELPEFKELLTLEPRVL
jgi:tetratricopeptide (TPR) repeat protein